MAWIGWCKLCEGEVQSLSSKLPPGLMVHFTCLKAFSQGKDSVPYTERYFDVDRFVEEEMDGLAAREWFRSLQKNWQSIRKDVKMTYPDLQEIAIRMNLRFFGGEFGTLIPWPKFTWSTAMSYCGGKCYYSRNRKLGTRYASRISISAVFHPHAGITSLESTLAHEMLHAYLWVMFEHGGHGKMFKRFLNHFGLAAAYGGSIRHNNIAWAGRGKAAAMKKLKDAKGPNPE